MVGRAPHSYDGNGSNLTFFYAFALLGKYSLDDLSTKTFTNAIQDIADALNIPIEELAEGKVTRCEIGLNIKTSIPCDKIIESVMLYSVLDWYRYMFDTVGFKGDDKDVKLYNKPRELLKRNKRCISDENKKALEQLEKDGKYFLRVEFTLYDKKSFEGHKLSNIRTIGGLLCHYKDLYDFWAREVEKIILQPKLIFDEKMTPKEYMIAYTLSNIGLQGFEAECKSRWASSVRHSKFKSEVKDVFSKYKICYTYDKKEFYKDVLRRSKEIRDEDENFSPVRFIKGLWKRP